MHADHVDALLRAVTSSPSRRAALRLTLRTALAMILTRIGIEAIDAKNKRHKRKKCKSGRKRCRKRCIPATKCCRGCSAGQQCCNGTCIATTDCCGGCSQGLQCCTGTCVDLATNGANCGACGHTCATNLCIHGACDCQFLAINCPAGCGCGVREEGGTVCYANVIGPACTVDAECPFRSSCMGNNFCSAPCVL